jgi:hypothetical protein
LIKTANYQEAKRELLRAEDIYTENLGQDYIELDSILFLLSKIYMEEGNLKEAKSLILKSLEL